MPGWEAAWPEICAEVERKVRRKLPPGVEASDVSNEVAAKLLAATNVPPPDRLRFWCLRVARCVVADLYRRPQVRDVDLPEMPTTDVEELVLARLRLGTAVEAVSTLTAVERNALTSAVAPYSNSTKARRKRARRRVRERVRTSVGAMLSLPKLRWLAAGGAVAAVVPFSLGIGGTSPPAESAMPDPGHRVQAASPDGVPPGEVKLEDAFVRPAVGVRQTSQPRPTRVDVIAVDAGDVATGGAGTYEDPDDSPPLVCIRNARPLDDVCVDHPLR